MELQVIRHEQPVPSRQRRVDRCVEFLCQQGCRKVTEVIGELRRGRVVPGMEGMNATDRSRVLQELVSIMSIYQGSCSSK
jgi:hypothetical protein